MASPHRERARASGFLPVLRNSSPRPWHFGFHTPGLPRSSVAGPLAAPGAARSGLRAPRWPACFARRGITRRLPFASRAAVKVPPPSLARCPGRPERASSPAPRSLANLPDPGAAERQRGLPGASEPLLALRLLGASAARAAANEQAAAAPPGLSPAGLLRPFPPPAGGEMGVTTLPPTGQCAEQQHAGPSKLPWITGH